MTGGLNPAAFRFGASEGTLLEAILESLLAANGTGFTSDEYSVVYAQCMCDARAIHDVWQAAFRLRYATDPTRMTEPFLSRWERILGLSGVGLTETARRTNVGLKMSLRSKRPTIQAVRDLVSKLLGPVFVAIVHRRPSETIGAIPGGLAIPGGTTLVDGPFCSHVAEIIIQVQQPASMSDREFAAQVNAIGSFLDTFLPAYTDWGWYANSSHGNLGFFLDERNLSFEGLSA